jgi:hypothetical protein
MPVNQAVVDRQPYRWRKGTGLRGEALLEPLRIGQ